MLTVRRYLFTQIVAAVSFVAVAFLSLFFFIDFVDELQNVGHRGYTAGAAAISCLFSVPGHLYELLPIALLIGTIYTLSRLAQSSEFLILRTAGLGPGRALGLLGLLGLGFGVLTFALGDWVVPITEQQAALTSEGSGVHAGPVGAWVRDTQPGPQGAREFAVNVQSMQPDGRFEGVRIYEFNAQGQLVSRLLARSASIDERGTWSMQGVERLRWPSLGQPLAAPRPPQARTRPGAIGATAEAASPAARSETYAQYDWPSGLSRRVVSAAVLPLQTMSTVSLYTYMRHLSSHEQTGQRYEIQFWKKALYPLTCLVMVTLALPFAYLQARDTSVSWKVFGGILLGITFILLNNITNHLGVLQDWTPWLAAITPSLLYLLLSLSAFNWLVRHR